jgi:hypothetical protein
VIATLRNPDCLQRSQVHQKRQFHRRHHDNISPAHSTGKAAGLARVFANGVDAGTDYVNPDGSADIRATIIGFQVFRLTYTSTDALGNENKSLIGIFVDLIKGAM